MLGVSPPTTSTLCASHPEVCGAACGGACVDPARDADNCGRCGHRCAPRAACNAGVCGDEPTTLVASAPGCRSMRLAHEDGFIYWSDMGHGTLRRVATDTGAVTTLAEGVRPAAIHLSTSLPLVLNDRPVGTSPVVRGGTVWWIGADDDVTVDETGLAHGGGGTAIWSVRAGEKPTAVLPAALVPGPSPVSSAPREDGGPQLETPGEKPPISALALSGSGRALLFAAGTRIYSMPSTGAFAATDVKLVGVTSGPEKGFATALATDDRRLFFPTGDGTGVHMFDESGACDPSSSPNGGGLGAAAMSSYVCPSFVFGSFPIPLLDTVTISHGFLTWAKENNVWRADLSKADPALDGHAIFSDTLLGFGVTGFAVGTTNAYFGESTLVETGSFTDVQAGNPPPARVLARGQDWPSSFVIDGQNVYWTTTACDISFIADSPQ
jgi:hypothetical protein